MSAPSRPLRDDVALPEFRGAEYTRGMPQFGGQGKPPLGVVYDADLGNTVDGALALAVLYGLQVRNDSRGLSVTTTKPSLNSATFAAILVRFYTGEPGGFFVATPIGMATAGKGGEDTPMVT